MQEWTKISNPNAQGIVKKHRSGQLPETPPDNQTIQLQMAIVSWQPGPNRVLEVPSQVRFLCHAACVLRHLAALIMLPKSVTSLPWLSQPGQPQQVRPAKPPSRSPTPGTYSVVLAMTTCLIARHHCLLLRSATAAARAPLAHLRPYQQDYSNLAIPPHSKVWLLRRRSSCTSFTF